MLLDVSELPGEWTRVQLRTWRAGHFPGSSDAAIRAGRAGLVTAWEEFAQPGPMKNMWIQVQSFVNAIDAQSVGVAPRFVHNAAAAVKLIEARELDPSLAPLVENPWVYEQVTQAESGPGTARFVAGMSDNITFVVCLGLLGDSSWDEVVEIATLQSKKIRRLLSA